MAVSANTLFHFTKLKGLKGILSSKGFYCQYSDEHFENILSPKNHYRSTYIPMISFCDLTITQLSNDSSHREYFGNYGIGLTKEWGIKNRISPVMYVHKRSQAARQFPRLIKVLNKISKTLHEKGVDYITTSVIEDELIDSLKYIKPYRGRWHKGTKKRSKKLIDYYNEREWRYCPLLKDHPVLPATIKENKERKMEINKFLKEKFVSFEPEHIKFILIQNKKDIPHITEAIQGMNIGIDRENELITKIRTFQEIKEDY